MLSEKKMKRYVITEYGQEELIHIREFVVQVPEGCDPEALDHEALYQAADEAVVGWEVEDSTGIEPDHYSVNGSADETNCDDLPVIRLESPTMKEDSND